nr:MAG TPA: hypothetical protein [Caudoviricetes sp.]
MVLKLRYIITLMTQEIIFLQVLYLLTLIYIQ